MRLWGMFSGVDHQLFSLISKEGVIQLFDIFENILFWDFVDITRIKVFLTRPPSTSIGATWSVSPNCTLYVIATTWRRRFRPNRIAKFSSSPLSFRLKVVYQSVIKPRNWVSWIIMNLEICLPAAFFLVRRHSLWVRD
jgi:hypothetical protein